MSAIGKADLQISSLNYRLVLRIQLEFAVDHYCAFPTYDASRGKTSLAMSSIERRARTGSVQSWPV